MFEDENQEGAMNTEEIARIVGDQRAYFKTHATFDVDVRRRALVSLRDAVRAHEADIAHALKTDLGKSHDEAYMYARLVRRFPRFDIRLRMWPDGVVRACVRATSLRRERVQNANRALWRHAHHGALELSVFADARAACWRPCRGQYRGHQAERLCSGIERGAQANL